MIQRVELAAVFDAAKIWIVDRVFSGSSTIGTLPVLAILAASSTCVTALLDLPSSSISNLNSSKMARSFAPEGRDCSLSFLKRAIISLVQGIVGIVVITEAAGAVSITVGVILGVSTVVHLLVVFPEQDEKLCGNSVSFLGVLQHGPVIPAGLPL